MFLGLKAPEGQEIFWQDRAEDIVRILDNLDSIEAAVPGLKGRLDCTRTAVAGHSAGTLTTAMLLGASNTDPRDGSTWYKPEKRIKTGVILAGVETAARIFQTLEGNVSPSSIRVSAKWPRPHSWCMEMKM